MAADRRQLMAELRFIVAGCRASRPELLEALDDTLRLAQLGETMAVGLAGGRPRVKAIVGPGGRLPTADCRSEEGLFP